MNDKIVSRYVTLLLCFLTLLMSTGCPVWPDEKEDMSKCGIVGVVSDVTTNASIPAVSITIQPIGETVVTGTDGIYRFQDLSNGEYELEFIKEGYLSLSKTISVSDMMTLDVSMERMPSILNSDKDELDFGDKLESLSFSIVNRSYWDLNWEIAEKFDHESWIASVVPNSGTIKYGKTESIVVTIDRSRLNDGINESMLNIRSTGDGGVSIKLIAYKKPNRKASVDLTDIYDISSSSASFIAEITDSGHPEYNEHGFICGYTPQLTIEQDVVVLDVPKDSDFTFSSTIIGLELGCKYFVRAYVKNELGIAYSDFRSFEPQASLPEVSISDVTSIDLMHGTAIFNGQILYVGDPQYHERGFVYSSNNLSPTLYDSLIIFKGDYQLEYSASVSDLHMDKYYYVRSYAKSSAGIAYSPDVVRFSTEQYYPSVITMDYTNEDSQNGSVQLYGKVLDVGIPPYTEKGFVYSSFKSYPTVADSCLIVTGEGDGIFTAVLEDLVDNQYYYRAYAKNNKGVVYGESKVVNLH